MDLDCKVIQDVVSTPDEKQLFTFETDPRCITFRVEIKPNVLARKLVLKGRNIDSITIWIACIDTENKQEIMESRIGRKSIHASNYGSKINSACYEFANSFDLACKEFEYQFNSVRFKIERHAGATAPMAISVL